VYNKTYYFLNTTTSRWPSPLHKHPSNLHRGGFRKTCSNNRQFLCRTCIYTFQSGLYFRAERTSKYETPLGRLKVSDGKMCSSANQSAVS